MGEEYSNSFYEHHLYLFSASVSVVVYCLQIGFFSFKRKIKRDISTKMINIGFSLRYIHSPVIM